MYYNELWNITPEENTLPSKLDVNCLSGWEPKMNIINITQLYFFREYHNGVRWTCKSIRIIKMVGQTFKITLNSYGSVYKVEVFIRATGWVEILSKYDFQKMLILNQIQQDMMVIVSNLSLLLSLMILRRCSLE